MKVYFVGIHHKPGMKALDSETLTGKVVDRIIEESGITDFEKINLFPLTYIPLNPNFWISEFIKKTDQEAFFVLLGKQVQKYLSKAYIRRINADHPGYHVRRGKKSVDWYVSQLSILIKNLVP